MRVRYSRRVHGDTRYFVTINEIRQNRFPHYTSTGTAKAEEQDQLPVTVVVIRQIVRYPIPDRRTNSVCSPSRRICLIDVTREVGWQPRQALIGKEQHGPVEGEHESRLDRYVWVIGNILMWFIND